MPAEGQAASGRRVAVIGGGWAGLSAAVRAVDAGLRVALFEMAPQLGGRARRVVHDGIALDNGQHILIGAYRDTLALMRRVGADPDRLLKRLPLCLVDPSGHGLRLPPGRSVIAFVRAVLAQRSWSLGERLGLLATAMRWRWAGFECDEQLNVAQLTRGLSVSVRQSLIEPLCVAALNTPADRASARVFLRVLRDALFGGPGSADLLLPRVDLSRLLPDPAAEWLAASGVDIRLTARVTALEPEAGAWRVDGEAFDGVVLACSAHEAARLTSHLAADWAAVAAAFEYEPIITVVLRSPGTRLPQAMTALAADDEAPAQFVFDLGAIDEGGPRDGLFAFVVSGARRWSERGLQATAGAVLRQASREFATPTWRHTPDLLHTVAERRATFLCTPGLQRPGSHIAPGLAVAGDYVAGPYPATLEGAVRSGAAAVEALVFSPATTSERAALEPAAPVRAVKPAQTAQTTQRAQTAPQAARR